MRRTRTPAGRGGFTLIELLVAAALSLVVMTVLSLAFQTGMQTLSQLKSVVGLAENLRAAEGVLRRDLAAYHLETDGGRPVRLSDSNGLVAEKVTKGFVSFTQGGMFQTSGGPQGLGSVDERAPNTTATSDLPQSFRTQSAGQASQFYGRGWMDTFSFTVRQSGDKPQEVHTAPAGGGPSSGLLTKVLNIDPLALPTDYRSADPTSTQMPSRWAEVTYFLVPSGTTGSTAPKTFTSDEGGVTQLPVYTLYRRARVLAERNVQSPTTGPNVFGLAEATAARGVAMAQPGGGTNPWYVLGPEAVANVAANRLGGANDPLAPAITSAPANMQQDLQRRAYPIPSGSTEYGSDVVLNNVVSMVVRPVYEFDVGPSIQKQLANNGGSFTPVPKSFGTPSYSPTDWLELGPIAANGTVSPSGLYPRFYDTAGPSAVGVVFRTAAGTILSPRITWNPAGGELSVKIKAIEVKLRVYDAKNKTTRQMTVLQDL